MLQLASVKRNVSTVRRAVKIASGAIRAGPLAVSTQVASCCAVTSPQRLLSSDKAFGPEGTWLEFYRPLLRALIATPGGDHVAARLQLGAAVAQMRRWKIPPGLADCVIGCAVVAFHACDPERGSKSLAAVQGRPTHGLVPTGLCETQ